MLEKMACAISGAPFPTAASIRKARAALAAIREPDEATASRAIDIAYEAENAMSGETCPVMRNHIRNYVDAILEGESK